MKKSAPKRSTATQAAASKKSAVTKPASRKSSAEKSAKKVTDTGAAGGEKTGTFDELMAKCSPEARAIARRLREIVYEVLPDAEENVWIGGWRIALYRDPTEICGIGPVKEKEYVNFYLTRGAEISDPDGLLEGKGKGIRHVKVRSLDTIPVAQITAMIREGKALVEGRERTS